VNLYGADHKGSLPRRGQGVRPTTRFDREADWFNALPPFLDEAAYSDLLDQGRAPHPGDQSIWMCPEAEESDSEGFFPYGMNMRLSTWEAPQPDRIDSVAPTYSQVFMAEGPGPYCSLLPSDQPYSAIARHRGESAIAFLDDHVSRFPGTSIGCGVGDPLRSDVVWIVPNSPWAGPPH
jgi:hypothetical protein